VSSGGAASAGFSSALAERRLARMKNNSAGATAVELKALMLTEPKLTLAVAESLTAGNVQARVASVSGASGYFLGGATAYALEQKVKLLGVDRRHAKKVNCVSSRVAEEMALGVCGLFGADVGVATTGYAEPSPADGAPVPMAWWAVARRVEGKRNEFWIRRGRVECPGESRGDVQAIVAETALAELVAWLREER
jgi:nicotinamide-nucleotide amidase